MAKWDNLVKNILVPQSEVTIAFVGKYLELKESYKSLTEALIHAGAHTNTKVNINWCDSERIEDVGAYDIIGNSDAVLVAGGFGHRGVEGKITAIKYARENKIPYLGICLGMQLAVVEFARNVLGLEDANSVEFDENTKNPLIYLIDEFLDQNGATQIRTQESPMGGTMRLGEYPFNPKEGSKIQAAYGKNETYFERHRHRYEANPAYKADLEKAGMIVSGESNGLIETVEIEDHPWFVGVQFHPEFTSRLENPNAIILDFVKEAIKNK